MALKLALHLILGVIKGSFKSLKLNLETPEGSLFLILNICFRFPQLESSRKLSEIKSLHDKIRVSTEEAKKKEEIYKQLVTD